MNLKDKYIATGIIITLQNNMIGKNNDMHRKLRSWVYTHFKAFAWKCFICIARVFLNY